MSPVRLSKELVTLGANTAPLSFRLLINFPLSQFNDTLSRNVVVNEVSRTILKTMSRGIVSKGVSDKLCVIFLQELSRRTRRSKAGVREDFRMMTDSNDAVILN